MRPSRRLAPPVFLALLWMSCSASVPLAELDDALREAACERLVRCGQAQSVELCVQMQERLLGSGTDWRHSRVDAGTLAYDGAAAQHCVDVWREAACDSVTLAPCRYLSGTRGEGEPCADALECREGLWCEPAQDTCGGTCRPQVAVGAETSSPAACPAQSRWDAESHRCEALPQEGEACASGSLGGGFSGCAAGLWCSSTSSTCRAQRRVDAGEACGEEVQCKAGLACTAGTCAPLARVGEVCAQALGESGPFCVVGLVCVPGEDGDTCQEPQEAGAACRSSQDCRLSLSCIQRPGEAAATCQTPGGAGAACDDVWDCDGAHYCDLETAQCRPWAELPACPASTTCPGMGRPGVIMPGPATTPTCRP